MALFLAIDAGGTSTRTILVNDAGRCLAYSKTAGGNPISSGLEVAAASIVEGVSLCLETAGLEHAAVSGVTLAMAGASTIRQTGWIEVPLGAIGVTAPVRLEHDLLATFHSGTAQLDGYVLLSGTGASAVRIEHGEVVAISDGLGWLLGDAGSGFWIGHRVVQAALAALDRRAAPTRLTELLLRDVDVEAPPDTLDLGRPAAVEAILGKLYTLRPVQLARFASLAFEADGDDAADAIVHEAAQHLVDTLAAVTRPETRGPIVLGGGILTHSHRLSQLIATARQDSDLSVVTDGVVGSAVIALRRAGVDVQPEIHAAIQASARQLRQPAPGPRR
jgi:N-acetylglucosamine kinase-like BadF-type ATPase